MIVYDQVSLTRLLEDYRHHSQNAGEPLDEEYDDYKTLINSIRRPGTGETSVNIPPPTAKSTVPAPGLANKPVLFDLFLLGKKSYGIWRLSLTSASSPRKLVLKHTQTHR